MSHGTLCRIGNASKMGLYLGRLDCRSLRILVRACLVNLFGSIYSPLVSTLFNCPLLCLPARCRLLTRDSVHYACHLDAEVVTKLLMESPALVMKLLADRFVEPTT